MIGEKHDKGKWRFSLLPIEPLLEFVKVLEYGCRKYAEENWKSVENPRRRYFDAMMRHLLVWFYTEEKLDPETGFSHLAHAGCCLWFLLWFELTGKLEKSEVRSQKSELPNVHIEYIRTEDSPF